MEHWQLAQRQSLPLEAKIIMSNNRIRSWYDYWRGDVYVSFSGGKDSTVLLDLVRRLYPSVPAVFVDTGLEFPEIREFVKTIDNVTWLKPKMPFNKVIEKYGYPVGSKEVSQYVYEIQNTKTPSLLHTRLYGNDKGVGKLPNKWRCLLSAPFKVGNQCCVVMKKQPCKRYEKETQRKPYIGTMCSDSSLRTTTYLKQGCNAFENNRPISTPLSFWHETDIWEYIEKKHLSYSSIYTKGYSNTGCMFCMYGIHMEKSPNRFQKMSLTHPKLYEYCIHQLGCGKVLDYIGISYQPYKLKIPQGTQPDLFINAVNKEEDTE